MPVRRFDKASALGYQYIFDDFPGQLYNTRIWSTRAGSGSVSLKNAIGGQLQVTANATNYYEVYQSSLQFSLAKKFEVIWRGSIESLTSSRAAWGMQTDANNRIEWFYEAALGGNWRARSVSAGTSTIVDVGIAADTSFHEFKIAGVTGLAHFFLDNVPMATITTNLATGTLAPHTRTDNTTTGTKNAFSDWVEAFGDRA